MVFKVWIWRLAWCFSADGSGLREHKPLCSSLKISLDRVLGPSRPVNSDVLCRINRKAEHFGIIEGLRRPGLCLADGLDHTQRRN